MNKKALLALYCGQRLFTSFNFWKYVSYIYNNSGVIHVVLLNFVRKKVIKNVCTKKAARFNNAFSHVLCL